MAQYSPLTVTTGQLYTATIINTDRSAVATSLNNIDNSQISAAAAIAISKTALGTFTDWTDWSPNPTGAGAMTYTSVTTTKARYMQIGKLVVCQIDCTGTVGGSPTPQIAITLPLTMVTGGILSGHGFFTDGAGGQVGWAGESTTTVAYLLKGDSSNWGAGSGRRWHGTLFYEVA